MGWRVGKREDWGKEKKSVSKGKGVPAQKRKRPKRRKKKKKKCPFPIPSNHHAKTDKRVASNEEKNQHNHKKIISDFDGICEWGKKKLEEKWSQHNLRKYGFN